jgi:uncharacterized protein (DUF342 family)
MAESRVDTKEFELEFMLDATLVRNPTSPNDPISTMFWVPIPVKSGDLIARQVLKGEKLQDGYVGPRYPVPKHKFPSSYIGPGTRIMSGESNPRVLATRTGYVVIKKERIFVVPAFEVQGNVDPLVGHVDCEDTVRVLGNVNEGMRIKTREDLEVLGTVEDSELEALGRVIIKGGISGADHAKITAGADVILKFAQKVFIQTPGTVIVEGPLINCTVLAGKKVIVRGKGKIVGGSVKAREGVEAAEIGSSGAIKTEIEVGGNPTRDVNRSVTEEKIQKLNDEYRALAKDAEYLFKSQLSHLFFNLSDLTTSLFSSAARFLEERGELDQRQTVIFQRFLLCLLKLVNNSTRLEESNKVLRNIESESQYKENALVKVFGNTYPGVMIRIRGISFPVTEELTRTMFYAKDNRIKAGNL